jgi:hypothetical protein
MSAKNKATAKFVTLVWTTAKLAQQSATFLIMPDEPAHTALDLTKLNDGEPLSWNKMLAIAHQYAARNGGSLVERLEKDDSTKKMERVPALVVPPFDKITMPDGIWDEIEADPAEIKNRAKPAEANTARPTDPAVVAALQAIISDPEYRRAGQINAYLQARSLPYTAGAVNLLNDLRKEAGVTFNDDAPSWDARAHTKIR